MGDQRKTKAQLITELNDLRRRVAELETSTVADDITARRRAEDALRESESFYHSLVEILPQSLCRKDLDGHFTFGNSQFLAPLNLSLAELVGKTDFDIHPPELAAKYRCDDRQVIETGQSLETAEEHAVLGGQTTFVQVVKSPIRDGAGKIIGVQIMFWDVTDRKRAEEALRQSEAHYRRLAENIGDVIWTMDMNFRFTNVTPSITQLLGLSVEEAMKRTLAETLTPASLALATQLIAEEVTPKVAQRDRY
jgi:PAS domain S-box-containing protein